MAIKFKSSKQNKQREAMYYGDEQEKKWDLRSEVLQIRSKVSSAHNRASRILIGAGELLDGCDIQTQASLKMSTGGMVGRTVENRSDAKCIAITQPHQ